MAVLTNISGFIDLGETAKQAAGLADLVRGQQPEPYRAPNFVRFAIGSVAVVFGLAVLRVAGGVAWFFRRRPRRSLRSIGLPLVVDLVVLWLLLSAIPQLWTMPLRGMAAMFLDMATLILAGAAVVTGWALARTVLLARATPSPADVPPPKPVPAAAGLGVEDSAKGPRSTRARASVSHRSSVDAVAGDLGLRHWRA